MNEDTKKALEESIEHWKENLIAPLSQVKIFGDACALCRRFPGHDHYIASTPCARMNEEEEEVCPVAASTGELGCTATPWHCCLSAWRFWVYVDRKPEDHPLKAHTPVREAIFRKAVQAMLNTLIKIRNEYIRDSDGEAIT